MTSDQFLRYMRLHTWYKQEDVYIFSNGTKYTWDGFTNRFVKW